MKSGLAFLYLLFAAVVLSAELGAQPEDNSYTLGLREDSWDNAFPYGSSSPLVGECVNFHLEVLQYHSTSGWSEVTDKDSALASGTNWPDGLTLFIADDSTENRWTAVRGNHQWHDLARIKPIHGLYYKAAHFSLTAPPEWVGDELRIRAALESPQTGLIESQVLRIPVLRVPDSHRDSIQVLRSQFFCRISRGDSLGALTLADSLLQDDAHDISVVEPAAKIARGQDRLLDELRYARMSGGYGSVDDVVERLIARGMMSEAQTAMYTPGERLAVIDSIDHLVRAHYPAMLFDSLRWQRWCDTMRVWVRQPMSNGRFWESFLLGTQVDARRRKIESASDSSCDALRNQIYRGDTLVGIAAALDDGRLWVARPVASTGGDPLLVQSNKPLMECFPDARPTASTKRVGDYAWLSVRQLHTRRQQRIFAEAVAEAKDSRGIFLDFRDCDELPSLETLFTLFGPLTAQTLPGVRLTQRDRGGHWKEKAVDLKPHGSRPYSGPIVLWPPFRGESAAALVHALQARPYTEIMELDTCPRTIPAVYVDTTRYTLPLGARLSIPSAVICTPDGQILHQIRDPHWASTDTRRERKSTFGTTLEQSALEKKAFENLERLDRNYTAQKEHHKKAQSWLWGLL